MKIHPFQLLYPLLAVRCHDRFPRCHGACPPILSVSVQRHFGRRVFHLPYHGITIVFFLDHAEKAVREAMPSVSVDLAALADKFCEREGIYMLRKHPSIEHIFSELYNVPAKIRIQKHNSNHLKRGFTLILFRSSPVIIIFLVCFHQFQLLAMFSHPARLFHRALKNAVFSPALYKVVRNVVKFVNRCRNVQLPSTPQYIFIAAN